MIDRKTELLIILQEEAGEVTQAVSKLFRFGPDAHNPKDRKKTTNIDHLETEIGDVLGVLKYLIEEGFLDGEKIEKAAHDKAKKLDKYMRNAK